MVACVVQVLRPCQDGMFDAEVCPDAALLNPQAQAMLAPFYLTYFHSCNLTDFGYIFVVVSIGIPQSCHDSRRMTLTKKSRWKLICSCDWFEHWTSHYTLKECAIAAMGMLVARLGDQIQVSPVLLILHDKLRNDITRLPTLRALVCGHFIH